MKSSKFSVIIIFCFFIVGLIVVNQWVSRKIGAFSLFRKQKVPELAVVQKELEPIIQPKNKVYINGLERKTRLDVSRKYSINVLYADGEEIAYYKTAQDRIYDVVGEIPNGKIKFTDETRETYGTEFFFNEKRHGDFREYYQNGNIRRDAKYVKGKVKESREYYSDGILRMEENYQDALLFSKSRDVGEGKVYYRDGKLMYEWNITNKLQGGYDRSYDRNGRMVAENIYDENGELVEKKVDDLYQKRE